MAVYSENITEDQILKRKGGPMFTILNSESLWIGTDMKRFNQLRDILEREGISYRHKVKNRMGQWAGTGTMRGRTGDAGMPESAACEYEILVYKKDWEKAKRLTGTE